MGVSNGYYCRGFFEGIGRLVFLSVWLYKVIRRMVRKGWKKGKFFKKINCQINGIVLVSAASISP